MRFYGNAIKESIDSLPAGILFYWSDGAVKLSNEKMERLCHQVTNAPLTNALVFMDALQELRILDDTEHSGDVGKSGSYIISLPDGQTLMIKEYDEFLEGERIFEVNTFDITEEMRLNDELRQKQERADEMNRHLLTFSLEAKYHAMEKEALSAKVFIHDELGHILLYMKQQMSGKQDTDTKDMFAQLKRNLRLLRTGKSEIWNQPYFICLKQAKELGVTVEFDGDLPFAREEVRESADFEENSGKATDTLKGLEQEERRQREIIRVIESAILAHTTNVLRHARGSHLNIFTTRDDGGFCIVFTNDGRPPAVPIKEGTGLSNLRQSVEKMGGTMRVEATPAYRCEIVLPYPSQKMVE